MDESQIVIQLNKDIKIKDSKIQELVKNIDVSINYTYIIHYFIWNLEFK